MTPGTKLDKIRRKSRKYYPHDKSRNYARIVFKLTKNIQMANVSAGNTNGQNRPKGVEIMRGFVKTEKPP